MRTLHKRLGAVVLILLILGLYVGYPRELPPDGTTTHTWKITAYNPDGTIYEYNGQPQDYWSETAHPRRNFGDTVHYH